MTDQPKMAPSAPADDSAPKTVEVATEQKQQPETAAPIDPPTAEPKKNV